MGEAGTAGVSWRKSSYSGGDNNCVEITVTGERIAVRDTKNRQAGAVQFSASQWQSFTGSINRPPALA